jgi:EipB-like
LKLAPAATLLALLLPAFSAAAVEVVPHRALYSMSLGSAKSNSGVVAARGTMAYQWGETCDGWTIEQRYRLRMQYADSGEIEISSNYVTWEAKDGLRYRFNERKLRNGEVEDEVRGEARLEGPGGRGVAEFTRPARSRLDLAAGTIFPTRHTIELIERAAAGEHFMARHVFDGTGGENAVEISAAIGGEQAGNGNGQRAGRVESPLLERPSWRVRLAFFPVGTNSEQPEYELGMRLHDNGVSRDMVLDYGDFEIKARLDEIEALPKPSC